jgi:hypothetical protein
MSRWFAFRMSYSQQPGTNILNFFGSRFRWINFLTDALVTVIISLLLQIVPVVIATLPYGGCLFNNPVVLDKLIPTLVGRNEDAFLTSGLYLNTGYIPTPVNRNDVIDAFENNI